ncbi:MAG: SRPBCC domain-containing protein [Draconibacterium sp.]
MKTFATSRKIAASKKTVFAAFQNPDILANWWGPTGFTNTFSQFEFRDGGKWVFVMNGPDGKNYPNESVFEEIIPDEKIVIRHIVQPIFTLTVRISEEENGSVVHWEQEFDNEEVAKNVAHIVIPSNEQNLDRLAEEVCK